MFKMIYSINVEVMWFNFLSVPVIYGSKCSRMDQVKFVVNSL